MKIAFIGTRGIPARYSGIETSAEEIALRLAKKGHTVTVYCRKTNRNPEVSFLPGNIKLVHIATVDSKHFGTIIHAFLSTLHCMFSDVDIVNFHALGPSVFSFLPRIAGKKTVVTIHALDWKRRKWKFFARIFLKLCEYPAIFSPHKTIVISKTLQEYFERKFRKQIPCITNGAALSREKADEEGTLKREYFLYVGRLVPEKGVHYLIRAFNEIKTDTKLVIAADVLCKDPYISWLRGMSGSRVDFKGFIEPGDLSRLYRDAYVFVLPSEVEGTSVSLLEAMSHGKCAVVSDIPESLEVIGDCGIAFKNGDYLDLKEKLRYLIDHPEVVAALGRKARKRVAENYDWEEIVGKLEYAYLSTLDRPKTGAPEGMTVPSRPVR